MANNETETTYDIACPYCFRRYTVHKALFVDYKNRTEHMYPEYTDYMKNILGLEAFADRPMPLYFQKRGNDGIDSYFSALTEAGDTAYVRACPYCCNILPAAAGREKPFSIVITGARDADRSFYISAVLHRLNRRMQSDFGASLIPADHKSALTYFEQYEEPLYVQKLVPEAMTSVYPLVYEFDRTASAAAEDWHGNDVTYNRGLIYIYNIDKELCDRYPMVAYNAIAQAGGIVFISDIADVSGAEEPVTEPWLGYLTETFRRLFGANPTDIPSAVVLAGADKAALSDRKWQALIKQAESKRAEKTFPTGHFTKISGKALDILKARLPAYHAAVTALFGAGSTVYFPSRTFFEEQPDGTADILSADTAETSFLWLLAKLRLIGDDAAKSFKITR
ncbi:MAG: hypothetical protein J6N15_07240 [Ruminiclostridium sp.]|nr:hypothetical protein [Ruminiclostridium sp.]